MASCSAPFAPALNPTMSRFACGPIGTAADLDTGLNSTGAARPTRTASSAPAAQAIDTRHRPMGDIVPSTPAAATTILPDLEPPLALRPVTARRIRRANTPAHPSASGDRSPSAACLQRVECGHISADHEEFG